MKYITIFLLLMPLSTTAQWREIGWGTLGGSRGLYPVLAFGVHDDRIFISQTYYGLLTTDTPWATSTWYSANTGIDFSQGTVTSFASLGKYLFASQGYNRLIVTSNNGTSWSEGNAGGPPASIGPYLFGALGTSLARSTDTDSTWTRFIPSNPSNYAVMGSSIFALTSKGIWLSTDSGSIWVQPPVPPTGLSLLSFAALGSQLFAGGSGVFRSKDSGQDWTLFSLADRTVNALAASSGYLFAGTDSGVFISFDTGLHWRYAGQGMAAQPGYKPNVKLLAVVDTLLYAEVEASADNGNLNDYRYVTLRPISEMVDTTAGVVQQLPSGDTIEIYPNPTMSQISIRSGGTSILDIQVLNVLGVDVIDVPNEHASDFTLDLSKLPSGTYFLEIETTNAIIIRKVVKE